MKQRRIWQRLLLAVPLFVIGFLISKAEFGMIWRYFGWTNRILSNIMLWAAATYLIKQGSLHWIAILAAIFMTGVAAT